MNRVTLFLITFLFLISGVSLFASDFSVESSSDPVAYDLHKKYMAMKQMDDLVLENQDDLLFERADTGLTYLASLNWSGMLDFCIDGDYLYSVDYNGLMVFDISDPSAIDSVSCLYFGVSSRKIEKYEDYVYLAQSGDGIAIVDVSDPENPDSVGRLDTSFGYNDIYIRDSLGFVIRSYGLLVYNLSDPVQPEIVTSVDLSDGVSFIHAEENELYLVGYDYILIIDISDPWAPVGSGGIPIDHDVRGLDVDGNLMFVAGYTGGTYIYDITTPGTPDSLAVFDQVGHIHLTVVVKDSIGYIGAIGSSCSFSYSDPQNPSLICSWSEFSHTYQLIDDYLYGLGYDEVICFSLAIPTCPSVLDVYQLAHSTQDVAVFSNQLYILESLWHFDVVDISVPESPLLISKHKTHGISYDFFVHDSLAITSELFYNNLKIYDISDPYNFILDYTIPLAEACIYAQDSILYLAPIQGALQIYDISDPANPVFLASPDSSHNACEVVVKDSLAAVLETDTTIHFYDLGDPSQPIYLSSFKPGKLSKRSFTNSTTLLLKDSLAIYTEYLGSLRIINLADILNPEEIWSSQGHNGYCLAEQDDVLYTSDFGRVFAMDIGDPGDPQFLAQFRLPSYAENIAVRDSLLIIGTNWATIIARTTLESLPEGPYTCGDTNGDGVVDLSDASFIIAYVFEDGLEPDPIEACDGNCDTTCDISDAIYLVNFVFLGGSQPCDTDGNGDPDC